MFQIDKTKCSYLGGLVDGEGNICIWRTESRAKDFKVSGKTYGSFNLRLHIANTSLALMKWLVSNFGGVYHCKREATDKHATAYEWRPKGENNTKRTLLAILPYLVIKREQALLALKYIDLPRNCPEQREPLYQRIRQLNQKGPKTVTTNTSSDSELCIHKFLPEWCQVCLEREVDNQIGKSLDISELMIESNPLGD